MNRSRLILGTVQFGLSYGINNSEGKPTTEVVYDILDTASWEGIKELDSADLYGDAQHIIGGYISESGNSFLINSKFKIDSDLTIREQLVKTIAETKTSGVYVYFYHRFDDMISKPASIAELSALKSEGLLSRIGVSVYGNEELKRCVDNDTVDVIQLPFNLLDNFSRRGELIRQAKELGKTIQIRSVFLQGLFFRDPDSFPPVLTPLKKYIVRLRKIAAECGISMHALALGYAASKKEIDGIIIGVDSRAQLLNNIGSFDTVPDRSVIEAVENIIVEEESLLYPFNWK